MKIIEIITIITLTILITSNIFVVWSLFVLIEEVNEGQPDLLYERVIKRFADTHEYNRTTYNCVSYAEDLGFILDNLGYNTTQERYIETENGYHRRLNLNLEINPQTAEVIVNRK